MRKLHVINIYIYYGKACVGLGKDVWVNFLFPFSFLSSVFSASTLFINFLSLKNIRYKNSLTLESTSFISQYFNNEYSCFVISNTF